MSRGSGGRSSRAKGRSKGTRRSTKTSVKMTKERARAIQRHADKTGRNQGFKSRAMSAAEKNEGE